MKDRDSHDSRPSQGAPQNMTASDPSPVHRIVYFSHARPELDQDTVDDLVRSARIKNRKLGITGALLFEHGYFFQVLEGPRKHVRDLFREIRKDDRHEKVHLLIEDDLGHRKFAGWSLAWNRESDEVLSERFEGLKKSITNRRSNAADLPSIHKFLIMFHGLIPAGLTNDRPGSTTTALEEEVTLPN